MGGRCGKFTVLHFSKAANCQLGPGRNPSMMNQYENGFHFHFAVFFYDYYSFPLLNRVFMSHHPHQVIFIIVTRNHV